MRMMVSRKTEYSYQLPFYGDQPGFWSYLVNNKQVTTDALFANLATAINETHSRLHEKL